MLAVFFFILEYDGKQFLSIPEKDHIAIVPALEFFSFFSVNKLH